MKKVNCARTRKNEYIKSKEKGIKKTEKVLDGERKQKNMKLRNMENNSKKTEKKRREWKEIL